MKRSVLSALAGVSLLLSPAFAADTLKVGISGGDSEIIWEAVKEIAATDGLDIDVVVFSDF